MGNENTHTESIVYEKIKMAINKRYIRPGSKLVETTIANQLGVSRTPVRAAIKRLIHDGFCKYYPNKGSYLISPTEEEIKQAFYVRILLEKNSAFLAANNVSQNNLDSLYTLVDKENKTELNTIEDYYDWNYRFHTKIAGMSGNHVLLQHVKAIIEKTDVYFILFDPAYSPPIYQKENDNSFDEHFDIITALESRNSSESEAAMENHLKNSLNRIKFEKHTPDLLL